jgi:hypothetical protein
MNRLNQLIQGLTILHAYSDADIAAEHDVIYAGPNADVVSEADAIELEKLGWHKSKHDCWAFFV